MKNGIVFQNGLKDVTGHVDVFYNEVSGGAAYTYYNDKKKYPNTITETWKYGRQKKYPDIVFYSFFDYML